MNRRRFIQGLGALFCAPAIVKAENIMRIAMPREGHWYIDWETHTIGYHGPVIKDQQISMLDFHRTLQDITDENLAFVNPSIRYTDNIIYLDNNFEITPDAVKLLKEGSLISNNNTYTHIGDYELLYKKELNRIKGRIWQGA